MELVYRYNCEKCDFHTNNESSWKVHLEREKHKTGKNKKRCDAHDGMYKCESCEYETANKLTYLQHKLNKHSNYEERRDGFRYHCESCDYGTFSKDLFKNHNESEKHKRRCINYK